MYMYMCVRCGKSALSMQGIISKGNVQPDSYMLCVDDEFCILNSINSCGLAMQVLTYKCRALLSAPLPF